MSFRHSPLPSIFIIVAILAASSVCAQPAHAAPRSIHAAPTCVNGNLVIDLTGWAGGIDIAWASGSVSINPPTPSSVTLSASTGPWNNLNATIPYPHNGSYSCPIPNTSPPSKSQLLNSDGTGDPNSNFRVTDVDSRVLVWCKEEEVFIYLLTPEGRPKALSLADTLVWDFISAIAAGQSPAPLNFDSFRMSTSGDQVRVSAGNQSDVFSARDCFKSAQLSAQAKLTVTLTTDKTHYSLDDTVRFVVTVANTGTKNATGVTPVIPLPPNVEFVSAASGQAGRTGWQSLVKQTVPCKFENGAVSCAMGDIAIGASKQGGFSARAKTTGAVTIPVNVLYQGGAASVANTTAFLVSTFIIDSCVTNPTKEGCVQVTYNYTGSEQKFTVPAQVCQVAIAAHGASGGNGGIIGAGGGGGATQVYRNGALFLLGGGGGGGITLGTGGSGGIAQTIINVLPSETFSLYVGGAGGNFIIKLPTAPQDKDLWRWLPTDGGKGGDSSGHVGGKGENGSKFLGVGLEESENLELRLFIIKTAVGGQGGGNGGKGGNYTDDQTSAIDGSHGSGFIAGGGGTITSKITPKSDGKVVINYLAGNSCVR